MTMSSDDGSAALPLGKYLASTDKKTRDKAVKSLAAFLSSSRQPLPKLEMAKLWKGIFYCYWMSDKPLVQQALASELAELLLIIPSTENSLAFLSGFWDSIVREWNGIDRLRMDKYYMLVRRFINASLRLMRREEWNKNTILSYNDILVQRGGPLCPEDSRVPSSLTYHITDIYLTELDKASSSTDDATEKEKAPPVPLYTILHPFLDLVSRTNNSVTYQRIFSEVLDPLFTAFKPPSITLQEGPLTKRPRIDSDKMLDSLKGNSCLEDPEEGAVEDSKLRQKKRVNETEKVPINT